MDQLILVAAAFLLVLLNAFFVAAEFALVKVRQTRIKELADAGNWKARLASRLVAHLDAYLSATQLGITLASIGLGWIGEPAVAHLVEPVMRAVGITTEAVIKGVSFGLAFAVVSFLHIVLGELAPKSLAIRKPEATSLWVAAPLLAFYYLFFPFIALLNGSANALLRIMGIQPAKEGDDAHSGEELRMIVAAGRAHRSLHPVAGRVMERTLDAVERRASELMVPRTAVVWIDAAMTTQAMSVLVGTSPYSNFPVCRGTLDQVEGVVHVKDLIAYGLVAGRDFKVSEVARKPLFVPETAPAFKLLELFQSARSHVAIVVDERGAMLGLVTINDVVAAILGDVSRAGEPHAPRATRRTDGSWLLDGRLSLRETMTALGIPDDEHSEELPDVDTTAGLILSKLGHIPTEGEQLEWQGWVLEVADVDGMRIDKVLATRSG